MQVLIFDNDYYNGEYVVIEVQSITATYQNGHWYVNVNAICDSNWVDLDKNVIEHATTDGCSIVEQGVLFDPEEVTSETTPHQLIEWAVGMGIVFDAVCDINKAM